jgi:hypothetical protein
MEQLELKHAQLMRVVTYFQRHAEIWASLAKGALDAGSRAYASKQAAIFEKRRVDAYIEYKGRAKPELLAWEHEELIGRVQSWRAKERQLVGERQPKYEFVYR